MRAAALSCSLFIQFRSRDVVTFDTRAAFVADSVRMGIMNLSGGVRNGRVGSGFGLCSLLAWPSGSARFFAALRMTLGSAPIDGDLRLKMTE